MSKITIALFLLFGSAQVFSQLHKTELEGNMKRRQVNLIIKNFGYACANGWELKIEDTIVLGYGPLPDHGYAYVCKNPSNNDFTDSFLWKQVRPPEW